MKKFVLFIVELLSKIGILTPIRVARLKFFYKFHRWPDFEHPKDLNEKINWMKFYGDTSLWPDLTDKYKVREYIEKVGLADTLVKLYGKWDSVDEIDWDGLPNQFVMKMNNGSGDVFICKDKSKFDIDAAKNKLRKLFQVQYGLTSGEPHYSKIRPCVIAEELLDSTLQPIKSDSLIDYKIWCFNGVPAYIAVYMNRTPHSLQTAIFDIEWRYHRDYLIFTDHFLECTTIPPRPVAFERMLECARVLSKGFPILRCDLYEVAGKVYFGEMTFTSYGGFMNYFSQDFFDITGNLIDLSEDKNYIAD